MTGRIRPNSTSAWPRLRELLRTFFFMCRSTSPLVKRNYERYGEFPSPVEVPTAADRCSPAPTDAGRVLVGAGRRSPSSASPRAWNVALRHQAVSRPDRGGVDLERPGEDDVGLGVTCRPGERDQAGREVEQLLLLVGADLVALGGHPLDPV